MTDHPVRCGEQHLRGSPLFEDWEYRCTLPYAHYCSHPRHLELWPGCECDCPWHFPEAYPARQPERRHP